MKRSWAIIALISAFFLVFTSCRDDFYQNSGYTWGTTYHITYRAPHDLGDSIRAVMAAVDNSLSVFNPTSTVSKVNAGDSVIVDSMFTAVFRCAQRVSALSGGMFDPTVGPLVELWGFGTDKNPAIPDSTAIRRALQTVGIGKCDITTCGILRRPSPKTRFNFSALAKGYGVDMVAEMLRRNGSTDYLVEIGGEVSLSGLSPKGKPWRIQIDAPVRSDSPDSMHVCAQVLELGPDRVAMATSGNYRNWRAVGDSDSVISHTISPLTGYPVGSTTASVTVLAPTCMLADALATAAMAMHPDSAEVLLTPYEHIVY